MSFSDSDLKQIESKGLTLRKVQSQIELFVTGLPFSNLVSAATIGDGIIRYTDTEIEHYINVFEGKKNDLCVLKFVPASGAATRMFKFLFQFIKDYDPEAETLNAYINRTKNNNLSMFLVGLEKFPFYYEVMDMLNEKHPNYKALSTGHQALLFVKTMLDEDKLNYGNFPKGLLPFHEYKNKIISTAFEEHLFESALYSSTKI